MKYLIITLLFLNLSINVFSQIKTKIGSQEESIYPLSLNQPNINSDLMPLKALCENREIIGMGEATHGTKEFFELKAKTFKFLVTECNFKVFTIEASAGGCSYINDYVQSGVGNIDSVMHFFDFWIWRTEEVKELVLWIKNYNQQKIESEKISFYGFDMQNIHTPIKYLNDVLKNDSTINFREFQTIVKPVLSKTQLQIKGLLNDKKQKFHDTLASVNNGINRWLAENKFNLKLSYTPLQYERISYCIENFNQASGTKQITYRYRDSCMANNVLKIQKIELLETVKENIFSTMKLKLDANAINEELIANIEAIFNSSQGKCSVEFFVEDPTENLSVKLFSKSQKIAVSTDLMNELDKISSLTYELT